jgi:hypothetical protein
MICERFLICGLAKDWEQNAPTGRFASVIQSIA